MSQPKLCHLIEHYANAQEALIFDPREMYNVWFRNTATARQTAFMVSLTNRRFVPWFFIVATRLSTIVKQKRSIPWNVFCSQFSCINRTCIFLNAVLSHNRKSTSRKPDEPCKLISGWTDLKSIFSFLYRCCSVPSLWWGRYFRPMSWKNYQWKSWWMLR